MTKAKWSQSFFVPVQHFRCSYWGLPQHPKLGEIPQLSFASFDNPGCLLPPYCCYPQKAPHQRRKIAQNGLCAFGSGIKTSYGELEDILQLEMTATTAIVGNTREGLHQQRF